MKKILLPLLCLAATSVLADGTNQFASDAERQAYALGQNMGASLKHNEIQLDTDAFTRGLKDALTGTPLLSENEMKATIQKFQMDLRTKQQQKYMDMLKKNKADGEAFLAANKSKPGVVTLDDGLQYQVLTKGSGAVASDSDTVTVNYRGSLIDGTEFDSSYKRNQPFTTSLGGVIPGWTEALKKMPAGSKWKLFIPSNLAYAERGQQPTIPPNSTLVFEVELLSVQPAPPPAPAPPPLTSDIIKVPSADELKHGAQPEVIKPEDLQKMQSNAAAGK